MGSAGTGENADLRDDSAHFDGADRARQSADAADFDDEVDTLAIGLFEDPAIPFGGFAVVEALIEAEGAGALKLGVAGGDAEDAVALEFGELQRVRWRRLRCPG